jgi:hypothetical protein
MASTPDGFLPTSVSGLFAGSRPGSVVLAAGSKLQPVSIAVTPQTMVWAGGKQLMGNLSNCKVGDSTFVATAFTSLGTRVALWMETNLAVFWGVAVASSDTTLTVATSPGYSVGNGATVEILYAAMTEMAAQPVAGESVYCVTTTSSPDLSNPGTIWARYVESWATAGAW